MKKYRFKVDLRKVERLGTEWSAAASSDRTAIDPEAREAAGHLAALAALTPAEVDESTWTDPLEAAEFLEIYNASLKRAQAMSFGDFVQGNIEYHVWLDDWGNKRVVSRPASKPGSRVSELMLSPGGTILRFSFEHEGGPEEDTDDLMEYGLAEMEAEPRRLLRSKGYVLRTTRLDRQGPLLVSFRQKMQCFDPDSGKVIAEGLI